MSRPHHSPWFDLPNDIWDPINWVKEGFVLCILAFVIHPHQRFSNLWKHFTQIDLSYTSTLGRMLC
jgi:cytosine/uracil/thiamine/allantoin permease